MGIAIEVTNWRNGDNALVAEYKLEPPFRGNSKVIVPAWRAIGGRFVTAVMDKENNFLSEALDGQRRHKDALASIGYRTKSSP